VNVVTLHGSEYSDHAGNIEIQEQFWVVLHPNQYSTVTYNIDLDFTGTYRLHVRTLAGEYETLLFGGSIFFDNIFMGDIKVDQSKGKNKILDTEIILEINATGRHTLTISNNVRVKQFQKHPARLHLRVMDISIGFMVNMKAVIANPEIFGVTVDFIETLEDYLSGLKNIGEGRVYEKNFLVHILVDHFKIYPAYINKFKPLSGCTILELGCGSGGSLPWYESYGATVVGVEIEPRLAKMTNSRIKALKNSFCVQADGYHPPFLDRTFDVCVCSHILEHVENPHELIKEIYRILKVGGVALIEFPNRLYPVERHGNLFLMPYLPLRVARLYATVVRHLWFVSAEYKSRLHVMQLLKGEYSYFSIKKIIGDLPVTMCDINPIDRFTREMPIFKRYPDNLKRLLSLLIAPNISILLRREQ